MPDTRIILLLSMCLVHDWTGLDYKSYFEKLALFICAIALILLGIFSLQMRGDGTS